ncbi:hypothetical protein BCR34DRAFT_573782 [Clohesyomyces aquaticus]|uniref:Uncharacterized protein n=1 Tax=Clohesyomyces aquaticus TaxID=1231657 RepID=A0A1Y1YZS3_9PLEO|nr:hypothetical protein BCR34DRAFT_573782 [Clohesyomyces aquaticus]
MHSYTQRVFMFSNPRRSLPPSNHFEPGSAQESTRKMTTKGKVYNPHPVPTRKDIQPSNYQKPLRSHTQLSPSLVALALAYPHPNQQRTNLDLFYISASLWADDVADVSQFLDDALACKISESKLVSRANEMLNHELDKLNHKTRSTLTRSSTFSARSRLRTTR